ncbi:MAG: hypothetical protein IJV41_08065 [Oscillospiraceae bacterium]|nr:hypothetical protein [Oscillospiraceae bacterium]
MNNNDRQTNAHFIISVVLLAGFLILGTLSQREGFLESTGFRVGATAFIIFLGVSLMLYRGGALGTFAKRWKKEPEQPAAEEKNEETSNE